MEAEEIKRLVVNYFANLFTESMPEAHNDFPTGLFSKILDDKYVRLSKPYTSEEVYLALPTMEPFKAPGPNGYQALFFQKYWGLVGKNVCDLVLGVLNGMRILEGLNDTVLALLPKVKNPQRVMQSAM